MKKKHLSALLGLTVALTMTGCAANEIQQIKTDVQIEVGSDMSINVTDYFNLGKNVKAEDIIIDTTGVDTSVVGNYAVNVTFKDNAYAINVSVVDTVAPTIVAKSDVAEVARGAKLNPEDYVEVTDASEYKVYFVAEDGDTENLEIPVDLDVSVNEINYTVVAVDSADNRSEEITVTVKLEKAEDEIPRTTKSDTNEFMGMTTVELRTISDKEASTWDSSKINRWTEAWNAAAELEKGNETKVSGNGIYNGKKLEDMTGQEIDDFMKTDEFWNLPEEEQEKIDEAWHNTIGKQREKETQELINQINGTGNGSGSSTPADPGCYWPEPEVTGGCFSGEADGVLCW